ncbi:uncharacterized protein LOC106168055 [Lingula anatina]|uniref:Uncharacterized protein LOC106168055 n=1 Tax=Lingula anatina TaxID=7574 RepID=A0A1S3IWK1_LINAN|nr:uncharacterized protein LOC106168055 [Lingula anatina]|eukprot:XP_013402438.1 uncharacterized protein LOC106168055 [Lingula anatina]
MASAGELNVLSLNEDEIYEIVSMWSVEALKEYLRRRDLSTVGKKEMLVAKVYAAALANVPVSKSATERAEEISRTYQSLLVIGDIRIPDPFVVDSWTGEPKSIELWPPITIYDISEFLKEHDVAISNANLRTRLLRDYKEQKAYSYFASNWVFEVKHFNVPNSSIILLRANVTPSQRLNDPPHQAWIASSEDGKILRAYCTCFAGLGQACNHVAAILFKVEYGWRTGLSQPTSTSKECVWRAPKQSKAILTPKRIQDMAWKSPSMANIDSSKVINPEHRAKYQPEVDMSKGQSLEEFIDVLKIIQDDAVFLKEREEGHFLPETNQSLPPPLAVVAKKYSTEEDFIENLPSYDKDEIKDIEKATRGQARNSVWFEQREGSLTASCFHDIHTKMESSKKTEVDFNPLISRLLYVSPPSDLPALKYGRDMEPVAATEFEKMMHSEGHRDLKVTECGLFTSANFSFLRASPDRIIDDACCGKGTVEIKCPISAAHTVPNSDSLDYLVRCGDRDILKENHKYLTQIIGQMAITDCQYCDFFVYSKFGFFIRELDGMK